MMNPSLDLSAGQVARVKSEYEALGDDVVLRRMNLKALIASLSDKEAHELSIMLHAKGRMDIFTTLPAELREHVARHLDGADIASVLNVSRSWRGVWSAGAVFTTLARRWLPGFIEYYAAKEQLTKVEEHIPELFYKASRNLRYRCLGQFKTCKFVHAETSPTQLVPRSRKYHAGKVAWQGPLWPIVVSDVSTGDQQAYRVPGDNIITGMVDKISALGNKLLVALEGRLIHAWDLQTGEHKQATLAIVPQHVRSQGHTVYMSKNQQAHFWLWDFRSGRVREVDIGEHGLVGHIRFLFHPLQDDVFFVILGCASNHKEAGVASVLEYHNDTLFDSFQFSLEEAGLQPRGMCFAQDSARANDYGLFLISLFTNSTFPSPGSVCDRIRQTPKGAVFFNTVTRRFSVEEYRFRNKSWQAPPQNYLKHAFETRNFNMVHDDDNFYSLAMMKAERTTWKANLIPDQLRSTKGARWRHDEFKHDGLYVDSERAIFFTQKGFYVGQYGKSPRSAKGGPGDDCETDDCESYEDFVLVGGR